MNAIEIKNLTKEYNTFSLNIENMEVKQGFITGFIGPNGAGKTTTIKSIMNMIKKDKGSIKIFGKEFDEKDLDLKNDLGYIGDVNGYVQECKLKNIKSSISVFYKNWDEKLYKRYIEEFELNEEKTYKELSKGQQKKFEIAVTLSSHPKLIIMDEPTSSLDPLVRNKVLDMLQERIEEDNTTVFFSTHITSDLDKVGDYVVFIYKGKIILQGDKDSVLQNHVIVKAKKEFLQEETKDIFVSINENSFGFEGMVKDSKKAYEIFGEEVVYDKPNLEDILTYYTRGNN